MVLLHGLLMPRRMQQPLARAMAAQGLHVVTLDLLGHGRSDQPADPLVYSMTAFGEQVVALLDHLGAEQAVVGGTSLGANVSLEVAVIAPERVKGLIVEMPVLNNALVAGILAFVPIMFAARYLPFTANTRAAALAVRAARHRARSGSGSRSTPSTTGPSPIAAVLHGVIFGRLAPSAQPAPPHPGAGFLVSATRSTRSTRSSTPTCWPPSCPTSGSSGPPASWSGGSVPSGSTAAAADFALECWQERRRDEGPHPETLTPEPARAGPWGRMAACPSTATRRSCCAPTSWVRPTASSPC